MLGANLKFRKIWVQLYVMHNYSSSRVHFFGVSGPHFNYLRGVGWYEGACCRVIANLISGGCYCDLVWVFCFLLLKCIHVF